MDYDYSSPIRKLKCEKCQKYIDISRLDLHERQCKVKEEKPKEIKQKAVVPPKPNPKKPESTRSQNNDIDERIPCINCDYQMKLTELDSHPKVCVNREINCHHCSVKYPRNLMSNHMEVCPSRPVRAQSIDTNSRAVNRDEEDQRRTNQQERDSVYRAANVNPARVDELPRRFGTTAIEAIRQAELRVGIRVYAQGARNSRFLIQEIANRALGKPEAGLPAQSIRAIPEKKYQPGKEEEMCSICCIQFKKGEKLKDLKCNHKFHTKCISEWLKINRLCPLCKTDLSVNVPNIQREEKVEKKEEPRDSHEESADRFLRILRGEAGYFQDSDDSSDSDAYDFE